VQIGWEWWLLGLPKQPVRPRADAFNFHKSNGLTALSPMYRLAYRSAQNIPRTLGSACNLRVLLQGLGTHH
jgi:hypothetical protein